MLDHRSKENMQQWLKEVAAHPDFKKRLWTGSLGALVFVILCLWVYGHFHVSTDDAYINADVVQIAPQINGRVVKVAVSNNQPVKKGQLLFEIDPIPYLTAVERAKAQLALARQGVAEKTAAVAAAAAQVAFRTAEWQVAKSTAERTLKLVKRNVLSEQTGDDIKANLQRATAALDAANAALEQTKINLGKDNDDNEQIILAKDNLKDAELNLSYTRVFAPADGMIANLSLRAGAVVTLQQPLFALISTTSYWVDTNLKETDLKNVRVGQKATIELDMYPDHPFKGVVESISGGSGNAFSLFPAQNATGNWVKITQRIPVRVRITEQNPKYPLRIGTSATVKINT